MQKIAFLLLITLFSLFLKAQDTCDIITDVISTYPVFPTENDGITIYFDATKGNRALEDYSGDIYAHTGVITEQSPTETYWLYVVSDWGENLAKTKFTRIDDNLYKLEIPDIHTYYGVPANEKILKIAMVIRSGAPIPGSSEYYVARNADGSDFFIPLYDDVLNVAVLSPNNNNLLYNSSNDTVNICVASVNSILLKVYLDETLILSDTTQSLSFKLLTDTLSTGNHLIVAEATDGTNTVYDTSNFVILPAVEIASLPPGINKGVNRTGDSSAIFVLWDPGRKKEFAFLIGDFNNWNLDVNYFMKRTPDSNFFWIEIDGLDPNKEYAYQFFLDGEIYLADPYANLILDPWNDQYIPDSIFPNLKPYPQQASGIVSVFQLEKPTFQWTDSAFIPPATEDLVIYELWIGDFTQSHSIIGVKEKLGYLQELGINAIELMPFNEFEGNVSWGYNPDFYFATDKYYGTAEAFKEFINECHNRGIAVIMDIVLNHSFYLSPMVQMYWDSQNNCPSSDNPWYNPQARHPFNVGYDFNHESPYTREFVKEVLKYWLREFHIDGFRFDLSKGFTQRYTTNVDQWSAYDQSRIDILLDYKNYITSINPKAYIILEHFAYDSEERVLAENGMLLWSNSNYSTAQALMGYNAGSDFSRIFYQAHGFQKPAAIAYMESHDEERIMYKALTWGNAYGDYNVRKLENAINRNKALISLFFAAPGPKMIWQLGELGYDVSIDNPCRTCPKPQHWEYLQDSLRHSLFEMYKKLIYWKKTDSIFDKANYSYNLFSKVKYIKITSEDRNIVIIGNFGVSEEVFSLTMPHTGLWIDLFSDSSFVLNTTDLTRVYQPGEFHFFTDKYIDLTQDTFEIGHANEPLKLFPNPTNSYFVVLTQPGDTIEVYTLSGKTMLRRKAKNTYETIISLGWQSGIYIVKLRSSSGVKVGKIVIN